MPYDTLEIRRLPLRPAEPRSVAVTVLDRTTGSPLSPNSWLGSVAYLRFEWFGRSADFAALKAVSVDNPGWETRVWVMNTVDSTWETQLPLTRTPDGKNHAEGDLMTCIGVHKPGLYRLDGVACRTIRLPFGGRLIEQRNLLTSDPFEIPQEPSDRCSA